MSSLNSFFLADGILSRYIPGYRARSQQLEMAQAIADTIANNGLYWLLKRAPAPVKLLHILFQHY